MARPTLLQNSFVAGMRRDFARNQMPQGSAWNMVDYIPNEGAPLRQRGAWKDYNGNIAGSVATTQYIIAGMYAPFAAAEKNFCIDEDGRGIHVTNIGATGLGLITGGTVISQNPVFHADLVVIVAGTGSSAPSKWDSGASVAALGGTPPTGRYATVFKDYTVIAATQANPRRLFFSSPGNPDTTWDTTGSIWDVSTPIKGLAALRNVIFIFQAGRTSRLRGSIPPPDGDMALDDPVYDIGILDARSIAYWRERVIWASTEGVFRSDGSTIEDLTKRGSMLRYWQDLMSTHASTWLVAGGVIRDFYVLTVNDGTTFKDAFLIDLNTSSWFRLSNMDATSFWPSTAAFTKELYWGRRNDDVVAKVSTFWETAAGPKDDRDGDLDTISPILETPFYEGSPGLKSWKKVYVGYELMDNAAFNPTMSLAYVKTPEETTYTSLTPTLAESTTYARSRIPLGFNAHGLGLKLTRTNRGDTLLYGIEAEVHAREISRLAA